MTNEGVDFLRFKLTRAIKINESEQQSDLFLLHDNVVLFAVWVFCKVVSYHLNEVIVVQESQMSQLSVQFIELIEEMLESNELMNGETRIVVSELTSDLSDVGAVGFELTTGQAREVRL